jgi:hypothetical protein
MAFQLVITAFCWCRKAKQTRLCLMRSKLEHVENVANQASSVMCIEVALCIQCTHLSHSRPITNVNHFQQSKIMRRRQFTLHAFTCDQELIQLKKVARRNLILLWLRAGARMQQGRCTMHIHRVD